jgi:hypothetical protein
MRKMKKGDLSLSINAIVILILAITMLGLGLAFMRNIFGGATTELTKVSGTVEKQLIEQMKAGTKALDISRPKVELKKGETDQVALGIRNDADNVSIFNISSVTASEISSTPGAAGTVCGSTGYSGTPPVIVNYLKNQNISVASGDVRVLPLNIIVSSQAQPTTCFYEISVCRLLVSGACDTSTTNTVELTVNVIR